MRLIASQFRFLIYEIRRVIQGYFIFLRTGKTPPDAYECFVSLYCKTRGWSNDIFHFFIRRSSPKYQFPSHAGVLGNWSQADARKFHQLMGKNGYFIFPNRLPLDVCNRLRQFASTSPCLLYPLTTNRFERYDPLHPKSTRYSMREQDVLENELVQALCRDYSLLTAAQAYLHCAPILDSVAMWWTVPYGKTPDDDAAQLYHFDMDRIKWIKFFIYLTDVSPQSGPHCFVARSHRRGGQPRELLSRGYQRISDDEIARFYQPESIVEFSAPTGTILAEDTRGFHKGKMPTIGERLIFEIEFCNSLFGAVYSKAKLKPSYDPHLLDAAKTYRIIYSKYEVEDACTSDRSHQRMGAD